MSGLRQLVDSPAPYSAGRVAGKVLPMREPKENYTAVPNLVVDDTTLDAYEHRLYEVIRRRDWEGEGWEFTYDDLMALVGCKSGKLGRALIVLRDRGLIRWEGVAKRTKRYFALIPGAVGLSPKDNPIVSRKQSKPRRIVPRSASDCPQETIGLSPKDNASNRHRLSKTIIDTASKDAGADAPSAAQNHTPAPPSEKPAKATRSRPVLVKEQQPDVTWEGLPEDVAKVAAAWMGVNTIRPQTATPSQIARYAAQASLLLDRGHPADHLVGCLRWLAKMRRETGKQWKVTEDMLADRVGQWQEQNGHAPDFFESNGHAGPGGAGSGPPWPSMPRGSIHDPETHAGREVFIAHFGKPPWMMSREEAIAAGVLDVYEKRRT